MRRETLAVGWAEVVAVDEGVFTPSPPSGELCMSFWFDFSSYDRQDEYASEEQSVPSIDTSSR
jgi:hypothetical protein